MRSIKKAILYLIISVSLFYISFISPPFVPAVICTLWVIYLIANHGLKGGLGFTVMMGLFALGNYIFRTNQNLNYLYLGLFTYVCMSFGMGIPVDIWKREHARRMASEEHLRRITDNMQDVIIQIDRKGVIQYISPSCSKSLGFSANHFLGKSFYEGIHPEDCKLISETIENAFKSNHCSRMEYRYRQLDGTYVWLESLGEVITGDKAGSDEIVISCREISERKESEDRIQYMLFHDTLTGLFNRSYFEKELERLLKKKVLPLSLIIGDVNGLKLTNDVFGHHAGDQLLRMAADIFMKFCDKDAIIVRWGGDEYAVLLPGVDEKKALKIVAQIDGYCSENVNDLVKLSIALGCATRKTDTEEMRDIIKLAEERMYHHKLLESRAVRNNIILSLEKTLFEKNFETKEHADRMVVMSKRIGAELNMSEKEVEDLKLLALLHDIGKIAIKDSILSKPGKLTDQEWEEIRKHSEVGYRITQSTPELCHIADYILCHHERWDGKGYPQGLKGGDIPRMSRIISIIDAYDVMTHRSIYKDAISSAKAIEEIKRYSGSQFDPDIAAVFIKMLHV